MQHLVFVTSVPRNKDVSVMNKWVNPPSGERKPEVYLSMPSYPEKPFSFYLEQVGKKKVVNNRKSTRIADKGVSLSERIGMQGDK